MNLGNQDITTVRNIKEIFQDIANRHYQINTFGWGKDAEIGAAEVSYPLLWVQPTNATMVRSEQNDRYTSIEVVFNVKSLDLVKKGQEDNIDVTSETLQSLTDIINEFNDHPFYQYKNMRMVGDISFDEVEKYSDDQTSGWEANLTVKMRNITSWCGIPSQAIAGYNNVTPQGFTATTFSQTDYYTTGATLNGYVATFDRNDLLSAYTLDLSSLSGAPDTNTFTTGATLIGNNLIFDRNDLLSAFTADLSALSDTTYWTAGTGTNSIVTKNGNNTAGGYYSVTTGYGNLSSSNSYMSFIGGGQNNVISGSSFFYGGFSSGILGGTNNKILGNNYSSIVGGQYNQVNSNHSSIAGGKNNTASGIASFIGGGQSNSATTNNSAIIGGSGNTISGVDSFIGGGQNNSVSGTNSAVIGGSNNTASVGNDVVIGGYNNTASGYGSTAIGGGGNTASGAYSIVGGSYGNIASNTESIALGGQFNTASGVESTVLGGKNNTATTRASFTLGGGYIFGIGTAGNTASGINSGVIGGNSNGVTGERSVVLGGTGITGSTNDTVYTPYLNIGSLSATTSATTYNDIVVATDGSVMTNKLFYIGVNFETTGVTWNYVAPEAFQINGIDNPSGLTYTLLHNGTGYTYGNAIALYDSVSITGATSTGFLKLNSELL